MRFLHTSDWHLGQKLLLYDRIDEHQLALNWLLDCIKNEKIDALIVAGDIFDIGNPPNAARRLYYQFLTQLVATQCRYVVIVGGNHDSPAMLHAPKELLEALRIFVVGAASEEPADDVLELRSEAGEVEAIIAAVPFLRDRDLQYSVAGIDGAERVDRIKAGIVEHYAKVGHLAKAYSDQNIPTLTTGHLYATGAAASAKQDNIYIGNTENIRADQFPEIFSYVALGHIHRMQTIGKQQHIRYSGSLIPLSFSETKDDKQVLILDYEGANLVGVTSKMVPTYRRLKTIRGNVQEVKERLRAFEARGERMLRPWVEILVETDEVTPGLDIELRSLSANMDLDILKIRILRTESALDEHAEAVDLEQLEITDVFSKKCVSYGVPEEQLAELDQTFRELQEWMNEQA
ncbi:MAG: exonuclease SbcCD subunit D C-terminal domain-containing protein [Bacteroidota bacterium]